MRGCIVRAGLANERIVSDPPMIDFSLPDEDQALLDSIDRMMSREFPPAAYQRADRAHETP